MISVNEDFCKGCYICIAYCPKKVFSVSNKLNKRGIYPSKPEKENECTYCMLCELICPDQAIVVKK